MTLLSLTSSSSYSMPSRSLWKFVLYSRRGRVSAKYGPIFCVISRHAESGGRVGLTIKRGLHIYSPDHVWDTTETCISASHAEACPCEPPNTTWSLFDTQIIKYVRLRGLTYIHTCHSYVYTPRELDRHDVESPTGTWNIHRPLRAGWFVRF